MLFNEPKLLKWIDAVQNAELEKGFSALQRAEIAEINAATIVAKQLGVVSVLFNEPKLLKLCAAVPRRRSLPRFSALQRAEIAEIHQFASECSG